MRAAGLSETQIRDVCDRIANHYVPWQEASFPGLLGNVVAGRIANRLDLGGTNVVTDAACASSFAALEMGLNELYLGQSDLVISGGVDAINDIFGTTFALTSPRFMSGPALSRIDSSRCFNSTSAFNCSGVSYPVRPRSAARRRTTGMPLSMQVTRTPSITSTRLPVGSRVPQAEPAVSR